MPAIEASTAVYLDSAQPSMTAVAARVTQQEQAIPADERIISAEIAAQPVELGNDELGLVLLARRERSRELLSFAQLRRRQTVLRELQTAQSREPGEATGNPRSGTTSASLGASVEEPKTQADRTVSQLIQFERAAGGLGWQRSCSATAILLKRRSGIYPCPCTGKRYSPPGTPC
jgi:hypothetical protein